MRDDDDHDDIIHILPATSFPMLGIANGGSIMFPIGQHIPTFGASEAVLVGRLHTGTSILAGQSLVCSLLVDAFTESDPIGQFRTVLNTAAGITFTGAISTATVEYTSASVSAGAGLSFLMHLAVALTFNQAAGGGAFTPILSLDIHLKGLAARRVLRKGEFCGYRG